MGRSFSRSRNFVLLRGAQFVADLGGNLSAVAVPATIVLTLHATPMQIGMLDAVAFGTIPLCAAGAGVAADRLPRRALLVAMNVVRLLALLTLPLAFAAGHATYALFVAVAAVVGAASSVFDAAYAGFVPAVVGERNIAAGTARLAAGGSIAEAAGTSAGGALVMLVGAPFVLAANVLTFVCSTVALAAIRLDEPPVRRSAGPRRSMCADARDGLACIAAHPVLRRVTLSNAVAHLGGGIAATVATTYTYRVLHLSPVVLGLVLGVANAGIVSAFFADRIGRRVGVARTLAGSQLVSSVGKAVLPLVAGLSPLGALLLSRLFLSAAGPVFAVNETALRSMLVPDALRGRAAATARALTWTALPVGSLAGGYLGEHIGLVATMLTGSAVTAAAAILLPSRRAFMPGGAAMTQPAARLDSFVPVPAC